MVIISFAFNILVGIGYLIGATLSGIAGYVGMLVSVQANVRTTKLLEKDYPKDFLWHLNLELLQEC